MKGFLSIVLFLLPLTLIPPLQGMEQISSTPLNLLDLPKDALKHILDYAVYDTPANYLAIIRTCKLFYHYADVSLSISFLENQVQLLEIITRMSFLNPTVSHTNPFCDRKENEWSKLARTQQRLDRAKKILKNRFPLRPIN